jgi:hypothetical protein
MSARAKGFFVGNADRLIFLCYHALRLRSANQSGQLATAEAEATLKERSHKQALIIPDASSRAHSILLEKNVRN